MKMRDDKLIKRSENRDAEGGEETAVLKTHILELSTFQLSPVREIIYCSIHSLFPLFIRHLLIPCHIPGTARSRHNLINSTWSQSSKKSKATKKAFVNTQVHCNIIWKALGTQCHGSPEEIINNFPDCVKKAYFIWLVKNEKELLSRKKMEESSQGKGSNMYHKASELYRVTECLPNREPYMDRMRPEGYGER